MPHLREWQGLALKAFLAHEHVDFLVSATPGSGKTTLALTTARKLLDDGSIERAIIVVPTDPLRQQWADAGEAHGISLMPVSEPADYDKPGYNGCVVTYQQLAAGTGAELARRLTRFPTLAIIDEIHHAGEKCSWGNSLRHALAHCTKRLSLTGTPWRSDSRDPIPFVKYHDSGKVCTDFAYEYGDSVADGVCRRVDFHFYDGNARWADAARAKRSFESGSSCHPSDTQNIFQQRISEEMPRQDVSPALEAIYDPNFTWIPGVFDDAIETLEDLRLSTPNAAGLVIADSKRNAKAYGKILESLIGERVPVVISDEDNDPGSRLAKGEIDRFRDGKGKWIVAVRMISEGIDIPRLAVGVYASRTQTPLFFRQVVGRLVRAQPKETVNATLFLPTVPDLVQHAREIEDELRHELQLATEEEKRSREHVQRELNLRESLDGWNPKLERAMRAGHGEVFTPEDHERAKKHCESRNIPIQYAINFLIAGDVTAGPDAATDRGAVNAKEPASEAVPRHRLEKQLRAEIITLTRRLARRMSLEDKTALGVCMKELNSHLRRVWGSRSTATIETLQAMRDDLCTQLAAS